MNVKQAPGGISAPDSLNPVKPARPSVDLIDVLQALGDDIRLAIVRCLAEGGERTCGSLAMPISKSTLTHHLHVLRDAGIISQREEGTRRMTRLNREGLEQRFPGLLASVLAASAPPPKD